MVKSNLPSHKIYSIRDRGEGKKSIWTEIGIGFENKDGSINMIFNLTPVDGKCQVRKFEPKENKDDS